MRDMEENRSIDAYYVKMWTFPLQHRKQHLWEPSMIQLRSVYDVYDHLGVDDNQMQI